MVVVLFLLVWAPEMSTIKLPSERVTGFPAPVLRCSIVKKNIIYPEYEMQEDVMGYTFAFSFMYLTYDSKWLDTLRREYTTYMVGDQEYYVFYTSLFLDNARVGSYGAGATMEIASDVSCYRLFKCIKKAKGIFIMPKCVIGYPNLRGQCYLISALIPLLFCPPFVSCLFNVMFDFKRLCHLGIHHEDIRKRTEPESSYYWASTLFKVYRDYHRISAKGSLRLLNVDYFCKFRLKDKEYQRLSKVSNTYQRPVDDLTLDRSLIKGLCSVLSTYCDPCYLTPGGDERTTYVHIIRKISSENPIFISKFFLGLKFKFTCSGCAGGPFVGQTQIPLLEVSPTTNLVTYLNNPQDLASQQLLRYPHVTNGLECFEPARIIFHAEICSIPEVLCFGIKNEVSDKHKLIPERLTFSHNEIKYHYFHLASSVVITCYKSKDGVDYGCFYHPFVKGDIDMGAHTFLHLRTTYDYVEINNGVIYKVDHRIFRYPTPCSLHDQ